MAKTIKVDIYSVAFGGDGVARHEGKVCFVEGAIPPEEVVFEVTKETPSYIKGKCVEILKPSPDRIDARCKYYDKCGGCQLEHIRYEKELFYKKEQTKELFSKIAGITLDDSFDIVPSDRDYGYRTSLTLHKGKKGLGFYSKDNRTIIEIDECPLASEHLNEYLKNLEIDKFFPDDVTLKNDFLGNVWSSNQEGHRFYQDDFNGTKMFFSPKAFSQANRYISLKIAETINGRAHKKDESTFFDVFCGAGFFSFMMKKPFNLKVGIDSSRISIDSAKTTAVNSGIKDCKFYKGDAEETFFDIFEKNKKEYNVVLVDPPRAGLKKEFLERLKDVEGIDQFFYLSCDASRLARDVKEFIASGKWKLEKCLAFDMFPRTKHVEVLVELRIKIRTIV